MRNAALRRRRLPLRTSGAGMSEYAIKVVQKNGKEEFLWEGHSVRPAKFPSRAAAERQAAYMRMENSRRSQTIVIVKYPAKP
jgi:hypothetical protein